MHTRTHLAAAGLLALLCAAPAAFAANVAGTAQGGRGTVGVNNTTSLGAFGVARENSGTAANVNDGSLTTRVDTFGSVFGTYSFAGVRWPYRRADTVGKVTFTIACFADGGWFGFSGVLGPGAGGALSSATHLLAPYVQVTTDGGVTWTAVESDAETEYAAQLNGHNIGGGTAPAPVFPNPNPKSFTITLTTPVTGINGIRVIGENGGQADGNGFLGVFEVNVDATLGTDSDGDGMTDAWETAHGLDTGVNDAAGDPDSDTLTNLQEYLNHADPQSADSDGDTLTDAAEVNIHLTYPGGADTDWDGLTDGAEINTHLTNPRVVDSDSDGLGDGAEVNTNGTNPTNPDTDGDQFIDGLEVARGTNPLSISSRPLNVGVTGTGYMGINDAIDADDGTLYVQGGATATNLLRIVDDSLTTGSDTFSGSLTGNFSFAGVKWATPRVLPVTAVELTMACFADGGWFGKTNDRPDGTLPAGVDTRVLKAANLPDAADMPVVQVTTPTTPTWTTVPSTTNYATEAGMLNHPIGGAGPIVASPTPRTIVFRLTTPVPDATGIRIIGKEGGTAPGSTTNPSINGFLGIREVVVKDTFVTGTSDLDADGLTDAAEGTAGTNPDDDDSDNDGFMDGREVALGTDPLSAASRPVNIARQAVAMTGINNAIDADNGTNVTNAANPAAPAAVFATPWLFSGNVNDGNLSSRIDTFNASVAMSHVGLRWRSEWPFPISRLELTQATFLDGGWFGANSVGPGSGGALTATHINAANQPTIQTSVDGITWTNYAGTIKTNYLSQMIGHVIGGGPAGNPTARKIIMTMDPPVSGLKGIRIIGREGGTVGGGFLGVYELTAEDNTTAPGNDFDRDGLIDTDETIAGTNPEDEDSDDDGLLDGAEVNTHLSNPLLADTDGDHFRDGQEAAAGSSLVLATSFPDNVALLGTGIMGTNTVIDSTTGITQFQAGTLANINDGNPATRVDTYNGTGGINSFVGIVWTSPQTVKTLTMNFATFYDGGWFGPNGTDPGNGGTLNPTYLTEPETQISTDGGVTWTNVPHTSDYLTVMNGHAIGLTTAVNPTSKVATFTLATAAAVTGIRLIGSEGGTASGGFLGCFELGVGHGPVAGDADNDGLPDAWEITHFGYVHAQHALTDAESDGSDNFLEYAFGMNPVVSDQPPAAVVENGYLTMTITPKPGIQYSVLSGSELTDFSVADTTVISADPFKVRDNIPIAVGPRRFMKAAAIPAP